jgi:surface polysaccharide O-acyltransferase-like enzyme
LVIYVNFFNYLDDNFFNYFVNNTCIFCLYYVICGMIFNNWKRKDKDMTELEGVLIMCLVLVLFGVHLYMMERAFSRIRDLEYQQRQQDKLNRMISSDLDKLSKR